MDPFYGLNGWWMSCRRRFICVFQSELIKYRNKLRDKTSPNYNNVFWFTIQSLAGGIAGGIPADAWGVK
jgi:hypothetical protein